MGLGDYVDAFRRRSAVLGPGAEVIEAPGLVGFGAAEGRTGGRVLVLDDRSVQVLEDFLARVRVDAVFLTDEAPHSRRLVEAGGFTAEERVAAMVRPELESVPELPLPADLVLEQVQRTSEDPPGVPFDQAIEALTRFDPDTDVVPEEVIRHFLLSLPRATLLAAVDAEGGVRATAASGVHDDVAVVVMVSTDPVLRGRGIGSAMTAEALRAARAKGAVRACLDASDLGEPIYRRLDFTTVSRLSRLSRFG